MVVREIKVVKVPRNVPLQDKPISFPKLENLHLDMMENKRKLKKNLPLIKQPPAPPSGSGTKTPAKKVAKYSAAVISGVSAGAAAATAKKAADASARENFVPAPASTKAKKPGSPVPVEDEADVGEDDEALLDELGDDGAVDDDDDVDPDSGADGEDEDAPATDGAGAAPATTEPEEDDPYAGMSPEERESKEKEEYIWRFKILKKKYKARKEIADYNEHDDLATMKQTYERTLREIQLEDNCESYRMYLVGGFMLMEFVSNNWMGVDLTGFTAHQMTMMDKYDRMLIELGEKSYNRWGSNLPVEIRLIGFIILQAGIFYLGKIIAEKGGGTMADIFKMFTGAPVPAPGTDGGTAPAADVSAPKKKMRGPSVKVADLRKKVKAEESDDAK